MSSTLEIACPRCRQRNRFPSDRIAQAPTCGKCHQPLLDAPVAATQQTFSALIGQPHLPVLVDFWAPWCAPCRSFAPTFTAAAARFAGQAVFAKVDTEGQPTLAQQFGIRSIPTLVAFSAGKEVGRVSGALPPQELDRLVRQILRHPQSASGGV
jgi:thioredoxin 2